MTRSIPARPLIVGALVLALVVVTASALPLQRSGPPDVGPGTKLYAIRTVQLATDPWPTAGPATPFEVEAVRGSWVLLDSSAIQRGPVWVNFDQVISFRHNP